MQGDGKVQGSKGFRIRSIPLLGILAVLMLFLISITMKEQYEQTKIEGRWRPFDSAKIGNITTSSHRKYLSEEPQEYVHNRVKVLTPHVRPLCMFYGKQLLPSTWKFKFRHPRKSEETGKNHKNLLAITIGIKQKDNVDLIVQKHYAQELSNFSLKFIQFFISNIGIGYQFLSENFTVILFHYDGNLDGWKDLDWSNKTIHIVAQNQTKWWFAKRFLHPDIVSMYDYIFIWDEDLGVEHFHPGRYLNIMKAEGLEISQPALDPKLSEIHHRITVRNKTGKSDDCIIFEGVRTALKPAWNLHAPGISLSLSSCIGNDQEWVEGMAPVFTRAAWRCTWHLIQLPNFEECLVECSGSHGDIVLRTQDTVIPPVRGSTIIEQVFPSPLRDICRYKICQPTSTSMVAAWDQPEVRRIREITQLQLSSAGPRDGVIMKFLPPAEPETVPTKPGQGGKQFLHLPQNRKERKQSLKAPTKAYPDPNQPQTPHCHITFASLSKTTPLPFSAERVSMQDILNLCASSHPFAHDRWLTFSI
eukprot:Gb_06349 [translate_table: standard]